MCDRFPRKCDVQTSYCEHQVCSGNLSHGSAFGRRTVLQFVLVMSYRKYARYDEVGGQLRSIRKPLLGFATLVFYAFLTFFQFPQTW